MTLDEIVNDYIREYLDVARAEMDTFRRERSMASAIRRAALCEFPDRKRHPHQYLIPKKLLELAEEHLQAAARYLAGTADFDALHEMVKREIGSVQGIGKQMVYDIAHRIGAYFEKPQCWSICIGERRKERLSWDSMARLSIPLCCRHFSQLTLAEIEDCLCIYKHELHDGTPLRAERRKSRCAVAVRRSAWK
jgi:hypothetical protein